MGCDVAAGSRYESALAALLEAYGEPEGLDARRAINADVTAHRSARAPRDQPGPAPVPPYLRVVRVGLLEGAEQAWNDLVRDADAGVLDLEADLDASIILARRKARSVIVPRSVNLIALVT